MISCILFLLAVAVHWLWCRWRKSKELQIKMFVVISLVFLVGLIFALGACVKLFPSDQSGFWFLPLRKTAMAIYLLLMPFYLIFYYSGDIDSPSRRILVTVRQKGKISFEELAQEITDQKYILTRLDPLVQLGYVRLHGAVYRLCPRARLSCLVCRIYQKLLGRAVGG